MLFRTVNHVFTKDNVLVRNFTETLNPKQMKDILEYYKCDAENLPKNIGDIALKEGKYTTPGMSIQIHIIKVG